MLWEIEVYKLESKFTFVKLAKNLVESLGRLGVTEFT